MVSAFLAYALLCVVQSVVPGPNLVLVLRAQSSGGRTAARAVIAAIVSMQLLWCLAAVAGVHAALERAPLLFVSMKLLGAAYIGWLGLQMIVASRRPSLTGRAPSSSPRRSRFALDALLTAALNPNTLLFHVAVFPQFLDQSGSSVGWTTLLVATSVLVALTWFTVAASVMERLERRTSSAPLRVWTARGAGAGLIGFGALMVRTI